ncbi:NmrA family NAD(P)-binding protein [Chitinophaga silvisoli]|uniref:NAD-dependent dehydratase n=1 Tax=Chitinophaga silvisoli TaxID=2291814 RepID=A0A3E1P1S0_9BACT|nr:NmrA family NAD(P)-binding protein [Chitinophaga silvisoli]RFM34102.1 NAD-dependent dehydratase [Chitinophaga silvisoli]
MKITLTGSLGNIGKPLAETLISAGHEVRIISSKEGNIPAIKSLGGIPAIGNLQDLAFLTAAFKGADVVYTMIPPNFNVPDYRAYSATIGQIYAQVIQAAGVTHIVNLSSMGAHLSEGTGLTVGAHEVAKILNQIPGISIKHLAIPYIFTNLYGNIAMIRHMGMLGANYDANTRLVMAHPLDIAAAVAKAIQAPFAGNEIIYVVSDDRTTGEVAKALGQAIGQPDLPWVTFSDEQALTGMIQGGIREEIARLLVEVGVAVRTGILWMPYGKKTGSRSLEVFAEEFATRYQQN